ncbi:unnamed protein product [Didymodactylos carnosus]|uniref:Uncharacterized protein n=1 Tax=Didymodactylos carnosus TaxID=1234261 RepID=A0A814ZHS7_9BILA|nr:unnamed protein product [Didymodactylos carnosus]CAF1376194.1 unnamed protein product [Didymodactylos carnosus]CAF4007693.1 unnamed protein product [Didymodactylos carnosus]CAF4184880.1 unnamed protein product [Didymodactylos carnosus]
MPWFETPESRGAWGYHWKMNTMNPDIVQNGKRQIAAHYYPLTGPYASADKDILEYQLLLMKYAGADGVFIDWPGTRQRYDYPDNLANSNALIAKIDSVGLKFAIVHEDRNWDVGMELDARNDFIYMQNNYFNKQTYLNVNGGPLVLNFGPITFHQPAQWDKILNGLNPKPKFLPLYGNTQEIGANHVSGEYPWIYQDHPNVVNRYYTETNKFQIPLGVVYPGFHPFYAQGSADGPTWIIPLNGKQTFDYMLKQALQSNVNMIQIATWNDYGEGTMIEPTQELQYSLLTTMQEQLGVSYGERELKLIFQLYQLRKQHKGNSGTQQKLDQAFNHLTSLNVNDAETILNSLGPIDTGNNNNTNVDVKYTIKNRFLNTYLYDDNGQVKYGPLVTDDRFRWELETVNGQHTRIKNVQTKKYMNVERGLNYVESSTLPDTFWSAYWSILSIYGNDGVEYKRIQNKFKHTYLNLEKHLGYAECTDIQENAVSGHWSLIKV